MTITCPHCASSLPITGRQVGDKVHHARCGNWVLLAMRTDGTKYGVKCQAPPKLPRKVYRDE